MSSQYERSISTDNNSELDNLSTDMTCLKSFVDAKIPPDEKFSTSQVTCEYIANQLSSLSTTVATGPDSILSRAPTYLSDKFHKVHDLHNIYTRQVTADNLSLPKFKLAKAQNSFSFKGAKLWNSLPISIKSSTSLFSFKRDLLKHLRAP